jgi:hypothetical protein
MGRPRQNEVHGSLAIAVVAIMAMLVLPGCAQQQPRSVANPGVAVGNSQSSRTLNSPYYSGSDPDYQRQGGRGKGGP